MLDDLVTRLSARLPELEWQLSLQGVVINPAALPPGLFRQRLEMTSQTCVEEIKADLQAINQQDNAKSIQYLSGRIEKKINVLVRLCRQQTVKKSTEQQTHFGVQAISTRQQWLQTMHDEVDMLARQQQALEAALAGLMAGNSDPGAVLTLKAELGEAERRLTLARETLARATVF